MDKISVNKDVLGKYNLSMNEFLVLLLTYNKANNILAYNDKTNFMMNKKKVINDSHFIEFDIENNPYIIESQSIKQFRYNENTHNKNTVK